MPEFLAAHWATLLPAAAGMTAIYLLLPRPRGNPVLLGIALTAAAVLLGGLLLIHTTGRGIVERVLFYAFSGTAVLFAVGVVAQRNPARSALCFAVVVLSTCGLFLLLAAPFLMAATTIIYTGAIIVTFLFVLMLSQQSGPSDADDRTREPLFAAVAGFAVLVTLLIAIQNTYDTSDLDRLIHVTETAAAAEDVDSIRKAIGTTESFLDDWHIIVRNRGNTADAERLERAVTNAELQLTRRQPNAATIKQSLTALAAAGRGSRDTIGVLKPPSDMKLTPFAGPPANAPTEAQMIGRDGRPAVPAANVAAIGRTLFTDYLLAVELGGTVLLVATIGAIRISARWEGTA